MNARAKFLCENKIFQLCNADICRKRFVKMDTEQFKKFLETTMNSKKGRCDSDI